MADGEDIDPPLTEPLIVPCVYVTGTALDVSHEVVRVVGWATLPRLRGEAEERRIMVRFAMPCEIARSLASQLRKAATRVGH